MRKIKIWGVITGILLFAAVSFRFKDDYFEVSKNLEIFADLYRDLNIYYVDGIHPGELMKTGVDAMLESLDPYTTYIPESQMEDYRFMTTGQYGGIGSLIRSIGDSVYVSEPYEGFPAFKAGLKAGDRIISIDGTNVEGKDQEQISDLLKGQAGTTVNVEIEREGKTLNKQLKREEIKIPPVPYSGMLRDSIGYIRLTSFTSTAARDVRDAFLKLKKQGMKYMILDLRGNGGGLLNQAVEIVNFFDPKGTVVVRTKGKISDWDQTYKCESEPLDTVIPMAVFVDEGSASASEIVSGSLQDLDRAVIIGRRTYGKGLVQQTRDLPYNGKIKLTVAKYYIPSGRCIQKLDYTHRTEDGKVEEVPDSLLKTFHTRNGRKVIDGRGIDADVEIPERDFPPILSSLLSKNLFFLYANQYQYQHDSIAAPADFHLTDQAYQNFTNYLANKDYHYVTKTEQSLDKLEKTAKDEKYWNDTKSTFDQLDKEIAMRKNNDLKVFRPEIQELLENEIVSRYYYQSGRIEASLANDRYLKAARHIFDTGSYTGLLNGSVPRYTVKTE